MTGMQQAVERSRHAEIGEAVFLPSGWRSTDPSRPFSDDHYTDLSIAKVSLAGHVPRVPHRLLSWRVEPTRQSSSQTQEAAVTSSSRMSLGVQQYRLPR